MGIAGANGGKHSQPTCPVQRDIRLNPIDYIESVKERHSTDSIVVSFVIIREFSNLNEGFIRARANLTNGDILDFSELTTQANDPELISYRYQWLDRNNKHIRRWDNALHYPKLKNFPHHIHIGEKEIASGAPKNIFMILDEIANITGE
jgi:hypothetical protein